MLTSVEPRLAPVVVEERPGRFSLAIKLLGAARAGAFLRRACEASKVPEWHRCGCRRFASNDAAAAMFADEVADRAVASIGAP